MIEVDRLTKIYGPTISIQDLSFSVEKGEVLGFLGPNGAGKSTTMRILTGLARPTRGTARIAGHDVQTHHPKVRSLIGYLPEGAPIYPEMTLASYLRFLGGVKGLSAKRAKSEMERVTSLLNLKKERPRLLRNLSKGTRQRAAMAQALLGDPEVLILDEPTVGLDPSQINDVRRLIRSMAGERTVILSTHILPEVELTCTRVAIIARGRIVAEGTPHQLLAAGGDGTLQLEVLVRGSRDNLEKVLRTIPQIRKFTINEAKPNLDAEITCSLKDGGDPRARLSKALLEAGLDLLELRSRNRRLEDFFLQAVEAPNTYSEKTHIA